MFSGQRPPDSQFDVVLEKVWGFGTAQKKFGDNHIRAYFDHYTNVLRSDPSLGSWLHGPDGTEAVVRLHELVKSTRPADTKSILVAIKTAGIIPGFNTQDSDKALRLLRFVLRLWLFSNPPLDMSDSTIAQQNSNFLQTDVVQHVDGRALSLKWLSPDFSAKTLTRKAGLYLVWTSELAEHLTFVTKDQLRVFRHATVLRQYQSTDERELYPDGFLEEAYRTIHLLFPYEDLNTLRRVRRIERRDPVDIEASLDLEMAMEKEYLQYQISSYRYYGPRLAEIQRRYDLAKPRRIQQWWFDRRQRQEWGALMIALAVFVLTVFFGVISAVTGIMQVWASFRSLSC